MAGIDARLERLEAIEMIKVAKGRYALGADPTVDAAEMGALFTEDAELIIERFGSFHGRPAIEEFLSETPFSWMFHCMLPQTIEVAEDNRSADAVFYLWELANLPDEKGGDDLPVWIAGKYYDHFIKSGDEWLVARSELKLEMVSPYYEGWVKKRFVV